MMNKKMKKGKEYEEFVYKKLKAFYPDFIVTLNDEIIGKESGNPRQIDISVLPTSFCKQVI